MPGFFPTVLILYLSATCFWLIKNSKPATLKEFECAATREELKLRQRKPSRRVKKEDSYDESLIVWGGAFSCLYETSSAYPLVERITLKIYGRRGFCRATFNNEKLVYWETPWVLVDTTDRISNRYEVFLLETVLSNVKNATRINLAVVLGHEAIS